MLKIKINHNVLSEYLCVFSLCSLVAIDGSFVCLFGFSSEKKIKQWLYEFFLFYFEIETAIRANKKFLNEIKSQKIILILKFFYSSRKRFLFKLLLTVLKTWNWIKNNKKKKNLLFRKTLISFFIYLMFQSLV